MKLRIATWNINSVRLRIDAVAKFVAAEKPDVLCLQEIKCEDANFPREAFAAMGLPHVELAGQKAYHGVATVSRLKLETTARGDFNGTGEARHLAVRLAPKKSGKPLILHNFYVPSGGDIPDPAENSKFAQKLEFMTQMAKAFPKLGGPKEELMLAVGDLNIAPLEHDVWSHKDLLKIVSHTPVEVAHFEAMMRAGGWQDVARRFTLPTEKLYSWWSYRSADWRTANKGRRLDHMLATPALSALARGCRVFAETRGWEQPSDHVPVIADFEFG